MRKPTLAIRLTFAVSLLSGLAQAAETGHAEVQLSALLHDRPRLEKSLESRPPVREWVLERFRVTDPPLFWDRSEPVSGRAAGWDGRDPERTLLRLDDEPSGIDQLVHLIFELHNVQGYDVFEEIHEAAVRGEVTRDKYGPKMLAQEFRALLVARAFYELHLSELSPAEEKEARAYYRMRYGTDSFEEHVAQVRERGYDLYEHYRTLFDEVVVPERAAREAAR